MFYTFAGHIVPLNYIGLDVSKHNIMNFQRKITRQKLNEVDMFIARAEILPLASNSINWVTCSEVLEHIEDKELALKEIFRVLAPGGRFLFSTPSKEGLRNWVIIIFPFRLVASLFRPSFRTTGQNGPFDRPIPKNKYMTVLKEIGFKDIQLNTGELLANEIAKYIPRFLLNTYIFFYRYRGK